MMDFSIFRPQNLSKSEPIYAYKRYAYKRKNMYSDNVHVFRHVNQYQEEGVVVVL